MPDQTLQTHCSTLILFSSFHHAISWQLLSGRLIRGVNRQWVGKQHTLCIECSRHWTIENSQGTVDAMLFSLSLGAETVLPTSGSTSECVDHTDYQTDHQLLYWDTCCDWQLELIRVSCQRSMHCNWPERKHMIVALWLMPYSIKPVSCNYLLSRVSLQHLVLELSWEESGANVNQASPDTLNKAP